MNAFQSPVVMVAGVLVACPAQPPSQPLDSDLGWKVNERMCDKWLDCWPSERECIWEDNVMAPECLAACTIGTELAQVCLRELSGYACPEDGFPVIDTCKAAITCPEELPGCVVDWR